MTFLVVAELKEDGRGKVLAAFDETKLNEQLVELDGTYMLAAGIACAFTGDDVPEEAEKNGVYILTLDSLPEDNFLWGSVTNVVGKENGVSKEGLSDSEPGVGQTPA